MLLQNTMINTMKTTTMRSYFATQQCNTRNTIFHQHGGCHALHHHHSIAVDNYVSILLICIVYMYRHSKHAALT